MMKIIITGVNSGIGKYLHSMIPSIGVTRSNPLVENVAVDVIIHCAFNSSKDMTTHNLSSYMDDNIFLTNTLLKVKHKLFIFFSTVDVYHNKKKDSLESDVINLNSMSSFYATTKLMSEELVKKKSKKYIILRPTSMVGVDSRLNSFLRIVYNNNPRICINKRSIMNFVLYEDIYRFIRMAINDNVVGIYNIASSENILISEVAEYLSKKVSYGKYNYNVGFINNNKITKECNLFDKSSRGVMKIFLKRREKLSHIK